MRRATRSYQQQSVRANRDWDRRASRSGRGRACPSRSDDNDPKARRTGHPTFERWRCSHAKAIWRGRCHAARNRCAPNRDQDRAYWLDESGSIDEDAPAFLRSLRRILTAATLHLGQRLAHLTECLLHRRARLHMRPPCRDSRTPLKRLRAESREQVGREEHCRRECAIRQREVGAACEAAVSDDLLELIEAVLELGHLLADHLF